jgi:ketosteroid isomerase-like protein
MIEHPKTPEEVAGRLKSALEASDLDALGELLDPDLRWGPPSDPSPPCRTREQVITGYTRGKNSGATARVCEIVVLGNRILVGLEVTGTRSTVERGGRVARWQVHTVRDGRVVDIVGFDQRGEAITHNGVTGE